VYKPPKQKTKQISASPGTGAGGEQLIFDFKEFLQVTNKHVPTYKEWLQIVAFLTEIKFPKNLGCALMNTAWNPENENENTDLWDSISEAECESPVTRASMVRYLGLYAGRYDLDKIFKTPVPTGFYNDYETTCDKPCTLAEVETLFKGICVYIFSTQQFSWKYWVQEHDAHGNKRIRVERMISKNCAFTKKDTYYIELLHTKCELKRMLLSFAKKNQASQDEATTLIGREEALTLAQFTEKAKEIMKGLPTCEVLSENVICNMQKRRKLRRYAEINFHPYVGTKNPLPDSVLNTFEGFPMEHYQARKQIDVKDTLVWRYMCVVFGWSLEGYNDRVGELLDRVAWSLQHPAQRSGKINVIYSNIQGIGKSAFFRFLSLIFSKDYCCFHSSVSQYDLQFDIHLNSKLHHFIDDLQGATKCQTRRLFPRVTEEYHQYQAKGERTITMNEYSELWVSGNDTAASLYVSSEDRRIVIYEAYPYLKNDKQFWISLYSEFNNLEVGKAWYDFMKQRDVSKFHPDNVHNASAHLKSDSILESMSKVHIFLERFFSTTHYHVMFMEKLREMAVNWFSEMAVSVRDRPLTRRGQVMIRLSQDWLYKQYVPWMRNFFPSSKVLNMNTFLTKLSDVGLCVQKNKQRLHKTTKRVVDLFYSDFKVGWCAKYKGSEPTPWVTEDKNGFDDMASDIKNYT
jgi:hypothetical protein